MQATKKSAWGSPSVLNTQHFCTAINYTIVDLLEVGYKGRLILGDEGQLILGNKGRLIFCNKGRVEADVFMRLVRFTFASLNVALFGMHARMDLNSNTLARLLIE